MSTTISLIEVMASLEGIGHWDLRHAADRLCTFDGDSMGRLDHLVIYRPGNGAVCVLRCGFEPKTSVFKPTPVHFVGDPPAAGTASGIGGYDLRSPADRLLAFDYDGSGRLDHLLCYRPGTGTVHIIRKTLAGCVRVYAVGDPPAPGQAAGIGGYDLRSPADRLLAFDYAGSGRLDHLLCYRPGSGVVHILRREGNAFRPVFTSSTGLRGGHVLSGPASLDHGADRLLAFDFAGSGRPDHLLAYRPGSRQFSIMRRQEQGFAPVTPDLILSNLGGWDLSDPADRLLAIDLDDSGKLDHLVYYRPGKGAIRILKANPQLPYAHPEAVFNAVFSGRPNDGFAPIECGVGTLDLIDPADRLLAFDYAHSGRQSHLLGYRPSQGIVSILKRDPAPEKLPATVKLEKNHVLINGLRPELYLCVSAGHDAGVLVGQSGEFDQQRDFVKAMQARWFFEPVDAAESSEVGPGMYRIRERRYGGCLIGQPAGKGRVRRGVCQRGQKEAWWTFEQAIEGSYMCYIRNVASGLYLVCGIDLQPATGHADGKCAARWLVSPADWSQPRLPLRSEITYTLRNYPPLSPLDQGTVRSLLQQGMDRWSDALARLGQTVRFRLVDAAPADVTFAWGALQGSDDAGETTHVPLDPIAGDVSGPAQVCFDQAMTWSDYGDLKSSSGSGTGDIRYVTMHEIGHVLGLDHCADRASVMYGSVQPEAAYTAKHKPLSQNELDALSSRYGLYGSV